MLFDAQPGPVAPRDNAPRERSIRRISHSASRACLLYEGRATAAAVPIKSACPRGAFYMRSKKRKHWKILTPWPWAACRCTRW